MSHTARQDKLREFVFTGTLEQFLGLVTFEQERAMSGNPDYDHTGSKVRPFSLHGPIERISAQYWLVHQGFNWFLSDLGERSGVSVGGPFGHLEPSPNLTLADYDFEARKQKSSLSRILGTGEMWVAELPRSRIRVWFCVSRFQGPDLFWKWVDSFVAEMKRQGFEQQSKESPGSNGLKIAAILKKRFNSKELRSICFELNVDYDDLEGDTWSLKAEDLVNYLKRRNRLPELKKTIQKTRPDISLDN